MDYFGLPAHIAACEDESSSADPRRRFCALVELAWYLRQRDSARARSLVGQAEHLLGALQADGADAFTEGHQARMTLVRAESGYLCADLELAHSLVVDARRQFEAAGDRLGAGDTYMHEAVICYDRGDMAGRMAAHAAAGDAYRASSANDPVRCLVAEASGARFAIVSDLDADGLWNPLIATCESHEHPGLQMLASSYHAMLYTIRGDYAGALLDNQRTFDRSVICGQAWRTIISAYNVSVNLSDLSNFALAVTWIERTLGLAQAAGWPGMIGASQARLAGIMRSLGRPEAARELFNASLQVLAPLPIARTRCIANRQFADLLVELHEYAPALEQFAQVESIGERLKHPDLALDGALGQAQALAGLGRWSEALLCARRAEVLADEVEDQRARFNLARAVARIVQGEAVGVEGMASARRRSLPYLERALHIVEEIPDFDAPDDLLSELSQACEADGDLLRALDLERRAARAHAKVFTQKAIETATGLQVRHETERTLAEAEHQRALASADRDRALMLQDVNDTLERLATIGQEITACLQATTVFETLHRHVGALLAAPGISIWKLEGGELALCYGVEDGLVLPAARVSLDDPASLAARSVRERREILAALEPVEGEAIRHPGTTRAMHSALCAPLIAAGDVMGVLAIQSDQVDAYAAREQEIFRALCAYGAVALANVASAGRVAEAKAELEREKMRNVLVHAGKLLTVGKLASGLAHEMSHPLGTMGLLTQTAQYLQAHGQADEALASLPMLHREMTRLQDLLRRLRTFSRSDPPRIGCHDLPVVLADARLLFHPRLVAEGVRYRETMPPVQVRIDAERLCLAIANIVFNACDAMRSQAAEDRLLSISGERLGDDVQVRLRDTGPGLPAEALTRLFEPFFTTKPQGLGLGLALSAESMASMGATVAARNHPDGGAEFIVRLRGA